MPNRPRLHYDYSRPGVAMITLKAAPGVWFCTITPVSFSLTEIGRVVQEELGAIHRHHPAFALGQYQIMPDHVHFIAHVREPFPEGESLRTAIRTFKLGVKARAGRPVFAEGMYDSLVFDRRQLEAEVAYIRDNVRRHRLRKANPGYFHEQREFPAPSGCCRPMIGVGNPALLAHPRRVAIRVSRRVSSEAWARMLEAIDGWLAQGYVFVSPFISEKERDVRDRVIAGGGRIIHLTHRPFGERHRPAGPLFAACAAGRVLELSLAREFPPDTPAITKAICERLNEIAATLAAGGACGAPRPAPKGLGAGRVGEPAPKGLGAGRV